MNRKVNGDKLMDKHRFGGLWTVEKLRMLSEYLGMYLQALKKQPFKTVYIDAFAGTGEIYIDECDEIETCIPFAPEYFTNDSEPIAGSAKIALEMNPGFDEYYFIDIKRQHVKQLQDLCKQYPEKNTQVIKGDANEEIMKLVSTLGAQDRAVTFLDPYGMSLDWNTLEFMSKIQVLDVWFLFNISTISRLMPHNGNITPEVHDKLNKIFGDDGWESRFYQESGNEQVSLFEMKDKKVRTCDPDAVIAYTLERMDTIFARVHKNPKVFYNKRNSPMFIFFFAMTNRGSTAQNLAIKFANHVLKKERMFDKMK